MVLITVEKQEINNKERLTTTSFANKMQKDNFKLETNNLFTKDVANRLWEYLGN